jgi:mRNA interferase RelE/StbE
MWRVEYSDVAERALLRLDMPERRRILKFFAERVSAHPDPKELAETLSGMLRGLWRFRIGDYRAICDIQQDRLVVLVLEVGHRREVYR